MREPIQILARERELKDMAASRQPHRRSSRRPQNMETSRSKQPRPGSPRTSGSQSIALGLERIGLIHRAAVSESDLVRTFGEAGLVATLIAMFAVLMLVPLLGVLLLRNESIFAAEVRGAIPR
jgi:hypothetical protein